MWLNHRSQVKPALPVVKYACSCCAAQCTQTVYACPFIKNNIVIILRRNKGKIDPSYSLISAFPVNF